MWSSAQPPTTYVCYVAMCAFRCTWACATGCSVLARARYIPALQSRSIDAISGVNAMVRHAARVGFGFTILFLAGITAFAQPAQRQLSVGPNASDAEDVVKQMVDRIMQPYLSQNYIPGAIVGVSLHRRRYFFSYGQATDAGAPFTADTLVEIGSCTKTFTTTLFALAVNRNQIDPNASVQRLHACRLYFAAASAIDDAA